MTDEAELRRLGITARIHPLDGRDGETSGFGIYAPDGRQLAAIADEGLAREFMVFTARGNADAARNLGLLVDPPTRHCSVCGGVLAGSQRSYCSRQCAGTATTLKNRRARQSRPASLKKPRRRQGS